MCHVLERGEGGEVEEKRGGKGEEGEGGKRVELVDESVGDVNSTGMKRPHFPNVAVFKGCTGRSVTGTGGEDQD